MRARKVWLSAVPVQVYDCGASRVNVSAKTYPRLFAGSENMNYDSGELITVEASAFSRREPA